ncbi:MFS transporter [Jeotgalibacillus aurantiacus]|uniref:MFS transporter n=1 Tax=Jeotgalibacillus aurantiacus TaxID=2763266 RepID=UPI001D0BB76C|nr:MFS transporter [Jeotgalibacillus aurantiacus]
MSVAAIRLLISMGFASLGGWIYFIALNLIIFNETGSAAAVAALYMIRPVSALLTTFWGGSLVDRVSKKRLLLSLFIGQSILVIGVAFSIEHIWICYVLVFFLQMLSSLYEPAMLTFTAEMIPDHKMQRFNSIRSLLDSGAFLLGPAVAGVILMAGSPMLAIYLNACALAVAAVLIAFIKEEGKKSVSIPSFSIKTDLVADWKLALSFRYDQPVVAIAYFLFTGFVVLQTAVDSLEVSFSKEVLLLSDSDYGFLVSVAGAGILIGSAINLYGADRFNIRTMIQAGAVMTAVGYMIFAASNHFIVACLGVFIIGLALSFANTGFLTYIQTHIPVDRMGRVSSLFDFIGALGIVMITALFAYSAEFISLRMTVLTGALIMLLITILLYRTQSEAGFFGAVKIKSGV